MEYVRQSSLPSAASGMPVPREVTQAWPPEMLVPREVSQAQLPRNTSSQGAIGDRKRFRARKWQKCENKLLTKMNKMRANGFKTSWEHFALVLGPIWRTNCVYIFRTFSSKLHRPKNRIPDLVPPLLFCSCRMNGLRENCQRQKQFIMRILLSYQFFITESGLNRTS